MIITINDEIVINQLLTRVIFNEGQMVLFTGVRFNKEIEEKLKPYLIGERIYSLSDLKVVIEGD